MLLKNSLAYMCSFKKNILLLLGKNDDRTPVWMSEKIYKSWFDFEFTAPFLYVLCKFHKYIPALNSAGLPLIFHNGNRSAN